ncbi:MAG: hypothetical protein KatS3mg031_0120 [Chitinophagales bacterium]|nr:MAG: hypothetical protein KatS3mg031_0120 [Chitinophagales bacterium]
MRHLFTILGLLFFINSLTASTPSSYLVSYSHVQTYTKESLKQLWKEKKIPRFIMPIRHDVDIYEIIYKVQWIDSTWRNASGIYFIPKVDRPLPYMMYGHGTQIHKEREISDNNAQQVLCLMFATDGYATFYPDYYGIGKGDGKHLYQHAWSEAHAFIYMLYAAEELNQILGIKHNGQLFITGYSQGGHAAMAAHKYLQELNDPRFQVTASSPMSGAYDMTGEQEKYMFQEYPRPFYLPYLLLSYQEAYKIIETDNPYSIFKEPFDTLLPHFFENNAKKTLYELDKLMPKVPKDVIKEKWVEAYLNDPNFRFRQCLEENNLTCWKPEAPVQLCYCEGDREVNYKNSVVAYLDMTSLGARQVKLKNISTYLDHNSCAAFAVIATKYFFDRFKKKGDNPRLKDTPPFKNFLIGIVKRQQEKKIRKGSKDKAYL